MHTHRVLLIVHGDGMERHRQQQTDLLAFFHLFFFSTFYLRSFSPHVRNDPFSGKCTLKSQWGKEGPSRAGCCLPSPRDAARKRCAPMAGLRLCQGTKGTEGDVPCGGQTPRTAGHEQDTGNTQSHQMHWRGSTPGHNYRLPSATGIC